MQKLEQLKQLISENSLYCIGAFKTRKRPNLRHFPLLQYHDIDILIRPTAVHCLASYSSTPAASPPPSTVGNNPQLSFKVEIQTHVQL